MAWLQRGRGERDITRGNTLGKGWKQRAALHGGKPSLPPSLPACCRRRYSAGGYGGREALYGEGSACCGMGYQKQRTRWPEIKATCCRSESQLFHFREISRSMALSAKLQQAPTPISPAKCIPLLPFTDNWRMLPGGFIGNKWRRKGWALDWHTARDMVSLPFLYASFSSCPKISVHAIRSHLKQFSEHTTSLISRTTDLRTIAHNYINTNITTNKYINRNVHTGG